MIKVSQAASGDMVPQKSDSTHSWRTALALRRAVAACSFFSMAVEAAGRGGSRDS